MEKKCREKYEMLTETLIQKGVSVTTMESCTGGVIAALITDVEGASAILKGAYITYSNEAKCMCGVPEDIIEKYGVYSEETAKAMAAACRKAFGADIGIGVTGTFADPDPANPGSTLGEVFYAICCKDGEAETCSVFKMQTESAADRHEARMMVADKVADAVLSILG